MARWLPDKLIGRWDIYVSLCEVIFLQEQKMLAENI